MPHRSYRIISDSDVITMSKKNAMDRFALSRSICVMGEAISQL
jgi:hypothetical protein